MHNLILKLKKSLFSKKSIDSGFWIWFVAVIMIGALVSRNLPFVLLVFPLFMTLSVLGPMIKNHDWAKNRLIACSSMFATGMICESLAYWQSNGRFLPIPDSDFEMFLCAISLWAAWSISWALLLLKFRFTVLEISLTTGLVGVLCPGVLRAILLLLTTNNSTSVVPYALAPSVQAQQVNSLWSPTFNSQLAELTSYVPIFVIVFVVHASIAGLAFILFRDYCTSTPLTKQPAVKIWCSLVLLLTTQYVLASCVTGVLSIASIRSKKSEFVHYYNLTETHLRSVNGYRRTLKY